MIYATFSQVVVTRNYGVFCSAMDIRHGSGTARYRTPAESRVAAQFLLAVNANRKAVFVNFNRNIAVVVEIDRRSKSPEVTSQVAKSDVTPQTEAEIRALYESWSRQKDAT